MKLRLVLGWHGTIIVLGFVFGKSSQIHKNKKNTYFAKKCKFSKMVSKRTALLAKDLEEISFPIQNPFKNCSELTKIHEHPVESY